MYYNRIWQGYSIIIMQSTKKFQFKMEEDIISHITHLCMGASFDVPWSIDILSTQSWVH